MINVFIPKFSCIIESNKLENSINKGGLYLSDISSAQSIDLLTKNNIIAVVTAAFEEKIDYKNDQINHKIIRISDEINVDITKYLPEIFEFIDSNLIKGNVLIHCILGISRSPSIVIRYLMKKYKWSFAQNLEFVKSKRNCVNPNKGFLDCLKKYEKEIN